MCAERIGVYTTMYPGVEPFLPDWRASLEAQLDREFELWVGLDSLAPEAAMAAAGAAIDAIWVRGSAGDSPARIRSMAIAQMVERYPSVVFVDSDDVLHPTRIGAARAALTETEVAACGLAIGDEHARDTGLRFGPTRAHLGGLVAQYNVFGLSNSAFRSDVLRACLPVPDGCILYDWLLATRAWSRHAAMHFDPVARMTYRHHGANIAGVLPPYTGAYVARACRLVLAHYGFALDPEWPMDSGRRAELEAAQDRAARFSAAMTASPALLEQYVAALNCLDPEYIWWWPIAHPELEELWSN